MARYGYARVSTTDQYCALQEQALRAAGCAVIRSETASATRRTGRTELAGLLEFLCSGDTLVVTRVDRLTRSIKDLQDIVHLLKERGVTLQATEQPIDTQSASGKAFLDMLGVFAEFETNLDQRAHLRRTIRFCITFCQTIGYTVIKQRSTVTDLSLTACSGAFLSPKSARKPVRK